MQGATRRTLTTYMSWRRPFFLACGVFSEAEGGDSSSRGSPRENDTGKMPVVGVPSKYTHRNLTPQIARVGVGRVDEDTRKYCYGGLHVPASCTGPNKLIETKI